MRRIRDDETQNSSKFLELCQTPSFGSASADTEMSASALALQHDYPQRDHIRGELDKQIYPRLLLLAASASSAYFRSALKDVFPDARFQAGHSAPVPHRTPLSAQQSSWRVEDQGADVDERLTICIAPVKALERTLVKFEEYRAETDKSQWPVTPKIRDTLRAKLTAPDGASFAKATETIMSAFDVREGNGRFKNNLLVEKHQPPNVLMNLVLRPPGQPAITAEVQIYLFKIETMTEHRYYEV